MTLVLVLAVVTSFAAAGVAAAQTYPLQPPTVAQTSVEGPSPPEAPPPAAVASAEEVRVLPADIAPAPAVASAAEAQGAPEVESQVAGAGLALTGADIVGLVGLALALAALGVLVVRVLRRPTTA